MVYHALADIYDRVMAHVRYDEWFTLIERCLRRYGLSRGARLLEIGGGTGTLGTLLTDAGYDYLGSDLSPSMCIKAAGKNIPFVCADGRALPFSGRYAMVLFLYDGINYLASADDYRRLFNEAHTVLEPDGLFLFDITTQTNSLAYFDDHYDLEELKNAYYVRHSYYDKPSRIQHNDFVIFMRDKEHPHRYTRYDEHHRQRVFSIRALRAMIPTDLFSVEGVWDAFSFRRATARSERIHFLLKKKNSV